METIQSSVVVPWHNEGQIMNFMTAWNISCKHIPDWMILQHDEHHEGCAVTKNKGVEEAMRRGTEIVIVLDDDCYPVMDEISGGSVQTLAGLIEEHEKSLEPVDVEMFQTVTCPASRGTPYQTHTINMPVAASIGFWEKVGDYDAVSQLVYGATHPMEHDKRPIFGKYFPLCGMNIAFRPKEWMPWCQFINVPRFDDIWMGFLWQKEAYRRGFCFNLAGPKIMHSRQSNVWKNLTDEVKWLERNETLWRDIAISKHADYFNMRGILPV